jgi:anti-sigma factor ChrR (cupin superfamily)
MKLRNRSLSCRKVAKQLQAYLDGEVDNATHDAIAAHLEMCRDCGLEADTYLAIKASLSVSGDRLQPVDDEVLHRLRDFAAKVRDDSGHGEST